MNHKFQFTRLKGTTQIDAAVNKRRTDLINTLPDGEYEIVIRKQIKWDVAGMRKYFHGPMLEFVRLEMLKKPYVTTKAQLKEDFKMMFGERVDVVTLIGTTSQPKSMKQYSYDDYKQIISDIKFWVMEKMQVKLPSQDEIE